MENNKSLTHKQQARLYVLKGSVYLQKGDIENAKKYLDKALSISEQKRAYQLMASIAIVTSDKELHNKALEGYKKIGATKSEIVLMELEFDTLDKEPEKIIDILVENDDIKAEYKSDDGAYDFAGIAALNLKKYEMAKIFFKKSYELKPTIKKRYLMAVSEIASIISRPGAFYFKSEEDKKILDSNLKVLEEIEKKISEYDESTQSKYWEHRLILSLFLDAAGAKSTYEKIPEKIKENENIKFVYADILFHTGQQEKAKNIYRDLYNINKSSQSLQRIAMKLFESKNLSELISMLEDADYKNYDHEGVVASLLIESIYQISGKEKAIEKGIELGEIFSKGYALFEVMAKIYNAIGDITKAEAYIKKIIGSLSEENFPPRFMLAKKLEAMGYLHYAIQVIEPFTKHLEKAKIYFIELLYKTKDSEKADHAARLTAEMLSKGESLFDVYCLVAERAMVENNYPQAMRNFENAFNIRPEEILAINIISLKINSNDTRDIQRYISFIRDSSNPKAVMSVALAYNSIKERGMAESYAIRSLALLGSDFDEDVLLQYARLYLIESKDSDEKEIILTKVGDNSAIRIKDKQNNEKWLCVDSEKDLIKTDGYVFIGCEHYLNKSIVALKLSGKRINEEIDIDGVTYKIAEIITRTTRAVRYCMERYIKERPDSPYLQSISIDMQDPLRSIIPHLQKFKERKDFLLSQYNGANGMGLPSIMLVDGNVIQYLDAINMLLGDSKQIFYTGIPLKANINNTPIVVSISSLFVLGLNKKIDILNKYNNLLVSKTQLAIVQNLYDDIKNLGQRNAGSMTIDNAGKPVLISFTDEQKKSRLEFYKEILEILLKGKQETTNSSLEMSLNKEMLMYIRQFIGDFELENILIAKENNAILVSDDNFVHRAARTFFSDIKVTNSISLLSQILEDDISEYIKIINVLSTSKYEFCCNEDTLYKMIDKIKNIKIIKNTEEEFSLIITNMLSTPLLFKDYWPIIKVTLANLYSHRLDANVERIMYAIMKRVKIACNTYKINPNYIKNEFEIFFKLDIIKTRYFIDLYNKA